MANKIRVQDEAVHNIAGFLGIEDGDKSDLPAQLPLEVQGVRKGVVGPLDPRVQLRGQSCLRYVRCVPPASVAGVYRSYVCFEQQHNELLFKTPLGWLELGKSGLEYERHRESYCFGGDQSGFEALEIKKEGAKGKPATTLLYGNAVGYGNLCALANGPTIIPERISGSAVRERYSSMPCVAPANTGLFPVLIRGVPHVFLIVFRESQVDSEVLVTYGGSYWGMHADLTARIEQDKADKATVRALEQSHASASLSADSSDLPPLLKLLESPSVPTLLYATSAILSLSRQPDHVTSVADGALVGHQGVPPLVALLSSSSTAVQEQVLRIFGCLAAVSSTRAVTAGAVPQLVSLLGAAEQGVREAAVGVVAVIAKRHKWPHDGEMPFYEAVNELDGGIPIAPFSLLLASSDATVREQAVDLLLRVCAHRRGLSLPLCTSSEAIALVPPLLGLLRGGCTAEAQIASATVLNYFAFHRAHDEFVDTHPSDEQVPSPDRTAVHREIVAGGGSACLAELLRTAPPPLQAAAVCILRCLVKEHGQDIADAAAGGALLALADSSDYAVPASVREQAGKIYAALPARASKKRRAEGSSSPAEAAAGPSAPRTAAVTARPKRPKAKLNPTRGDGGNGGGSKRQAGLKKPKVEFDSE